jgi:hypothetical protein
MIRIYDKSFLLFYSGILHIIFHLNIEKIIFLFVSMAYFFFFLKKLQEDQDVRNLFVKIVLHGGTLENYNKTTIVRDLFLLIFHLLFIVTPPLTFFNKRVGSVKFAIPFYLDPFARYTLGVKRVFQLAALRFKKNKNYGECLGEEFIEIIKGRSQLLKKKQEEERLFKFNRAFLYYLKGK